MFVLFLFVFAYSLPTGCDSGDTDIGIEGFNSHGAAGTLHTDTLYADAITNYTSLMDSISTGGSDRLYLGSVDDYDFKIVMFFVFPSEIESVHVTGAQLKLTSTASYGSGGSFTAAIHPVQKSWNVGDLRWNRFDGAVDTSVIISQVSIANTPAAGTVFSFSDSALKDTVQNWIYAIRDTNRHNYGIMIDVPLGAGFVQQFYSGNNTSGAGVPDTAIVPRLEFSYTRVVNGEVNTGTLSITPVTLSNSFGGNSYFGGSHGYLYRDRNPQASNSLTVGSGVVYHALLKFNTDSIPASATINNAVLVMHLDPAGNYFYNANTDSVALQGIRVETQPADWKAGELTINGNDFSGILNSASYRSRLTDHIKGTDDTLRMSIGTQLQGWIGRPAGNAGLELFNADELSGNFRRLYRVRFINNPGDRDHSPKIIVYYTLPPDQ